MEVELDSIRRAKYDVSHRWVVVECRSLFFWWRRLNDALFHGRNVWMDETLGDEVGLGLQRMKVSRETTLSALNAPECYRSTHPVLHIRVPNTMPRSAAGGQVS